jgi:hypothetical protein
LKEQTDTNEEKQTVVEEVSTSQRQADALALLVESAMDHSLARGSRADRYQVVVHVDADALEDRSQVTPPKNSAETHATPESLNQGAPPKNSAEAWMRAELENGVGLCAETCRRLACEGCTVILSEDQQRACPDPEHSFILTSDINIGRKKRRLSAALSRALNNRDRGCQFPGCSHTRYVEAHHLVHWADGGPTELDNLANLCGFHHHAVHEQGFRVTRDENGSLRFFRPDGSRLPASPPPLVLSDDPVQRLAKQHVDDGLKISDSSGGPTEWTGTPFDIYDAVDCLLP